MRRLRTYAPGTYFIAHHFFMFFGLIWVVSGRLLMPFGHFSDTSRALPGASGASFECAGCADPRAALFFHVCIYIWGLYFVRRLRGSWPGVILASPRDYPWHLGGLFYMRSLRGSACGIFFYDCIYIWGLYFVRRLRGSMPAAFWLLPGMPCGLAVSLWWLFFYTDCIDLCPQTLDRNSCSRTVAS